MSVAVVADAHLGGPGGPAGPLIEQLRALPDRGCRSLLFLGDLFHVWVGARRYETEEIRAVVPVIAELRRQGIGVAYIEGNRDFFLEGSPYEEAFDRIDTEISFTLGSRRYLAVHGDGLDERDWNYRFWRWLSKSAPSRLLFRRLPRRLARRVVYSTEERLSQTNFKHKVEIPEKVLRDYGQTRLAEGHDVLLLGHFHDPCRYRVGDGEVRIVDAWFHGNHIEWLEGDVA